MKTTIIITILALAACTGDDTGNGTDATTTTAPDESSSDAGSSSDDSGSSDAGDELDDDSSSDDSGSSSSGDSTETTGALACDPVTYVNESGMPFTCCCDGTGPEDAACPEDLPWCACDAPSALPEHSACGSGCESLCAIGLSCRENYAGGALAECASPCSADVDCDTVGDVCSAGWCVTPCGPEGECTEGSHCYPGTELDGTPIVDPAHPVPHCMAQVPA